MQKHLDTILNLIENTKLPGVTHPRTIKFLKLFFHEAFVRYLIIGFSSLAIQFGFYWLFNKLSNLTTISNAIAQLISMIFNFILSNYWTFKAGHGNHAKKISKYLILALANYLFSVISFSILVDHIGINAYWAIIINTGFIVCWNFLLYKFWVFK